MDDEGCIHGLGPVSACVICNGRAQREAAEEARAHRTRDEDAYAFRAGYFGTCPACFGLISEGDQIVRTVAKTYAHAVCAS